MAKKSKWFRVALAGATTDGREISDQDIKDMAETYNRATYGARVNLEHYRGLIAGSSFDMLGDVLAVKAQEDELTIGGKSQKRLALYAEIEPLDNLLKLNDAGQKIFTSIEVQPDFAKTGKAGLVGLAVTDSPASLGTEVLKFSAKNPAFFASRKQQEGNLFTEAHETKIEFIDVADPDPTAGESAKAFASIRNFFDTLTGKATDAKKVEDDKKVDVVDPALAANADSIKQFATEMSKFTTMMEKSLTDLATATKKNADDLTALTKRLEDEPDTRKHSRRPPVSGGKGDAARAVY